MDMNYRVFIQPVVLLYSLVIPFFSCSSEVNSCKYDTDCKGDKVCKNGVCVGLYENLDIGQIKDVDISAGDIVKEDILFKDNESDIDEHSELSDVIGSEVYDEEGLKDVNCPSPCEYEGKRFCRDKGYVECKINGEDECPTEVYIECQSDEECRNGFCGKDECTEGDRVCENESEFLICQIDENGFLKMIKKNCDIGTFCQNKLCCPADMVEANGFCIDKYEAIVSDSPACIGAIYGQSGDNYPAGFPDNVSLIDNPPSISLFACSKSGTLPSRYITYLQASAVCQLSGKRLCTEKEYIIACTGNNPNYKYPYGPSYVQSRCNVYGFLKKPTNCGEYAQCVSTCGTYDMSGNVEEWVESDISDNKAFAMGGYAGCLPNDSCSMCTAKIEKNITASNEYLGFRCCK